MADYRVWQCLVCGWIYDEARGWPEDGIAPGTRWEDIPDDWLCPECGVGKGDFEMVALEPQLTPPPSANPSKEAPIVIIGTGLAGYTLARELRKRDSKSPLVLISRDDGSYYSKPLLSTSMHQHKQAHELASESAVDMARSLQAELLIYTEVTAINTAARTLTLTRQQISRQLKYTKLVLATGAEAIIPPVAGDASGQLYSINNLQDYACFQSASTGKRRLLIMGAGLIGTEFTNDLIQAGFEVHLVDPLDRLLGQLLPEPVSLSLQQKLQAAGAQMHLNTVVQSLSESPRGLCAQLANGEQLDVDLVLSAVGVKANSRLAAEAGLNCNRGIVVDRFLQTSAPNVYALGDCAEVDGHLLYYLAPLFAGARALAATLAGEPTEVHYDTMPVTIKTTLFPVVACPPPAQLEGHWQTLEATAEGVECHFYDQHNQLRGFALGGNRITQTDSLKRQTPGPMAAP